MGRATSADVGLLCSSGCSHHTETSLDARLDELLRERAKVCAEIQAIDERDELLRERAKVCAEIQAIDDHLIKTRHADEELAEGLLARIGRLFTVPAPVPSPPETQAFEAEQAVAPRLLGRTSGIGSGIQTFTKKVAGTPKPADLTVGLEATELAPALTIGFLVGAEAKTLTFNSKMLGMVFHRELLGEYPLVVSEVLEGSEAEQLGVKAGWRIATIGGQMAFSALTAGMM